MPRSRTGCLTCRQRKLKCGEEKPTCAQCTKAQRHCIPGSPITFRHQQNPSLNGAIQGEDSLQSFYGYKATFSKDAQWVAVPHDLTFVHTINPFEEDGNHGLHDEPALSQTPDASHRDDELAQRLAVLADNATRYSETRLAREWESSPSSAYPAYATQGLEALSTAASQDRYNYHAQPSTHEQRASNQDRTTLDVSNVPQAPNNIAFILNHASGELSGGDVNIDPQLHSERPPSVGQAMSRPPDQRAPSHVRSSSSISSFGRPCLHAKGSFCRNPPLNDPKLAFLMRDFSERVGHWMDLFDLNLFFAMQVPILASRCPLLLYSCAACSAKSLARVNGRKPIMGGQVGPERRSATEIWPGPRLEAEGWMHLGRRYYDIAVSLLRQALAGSSQPQKSSLPLDATPDNIVTAQGVPLPSTDSDELVAATAILCVYEFLDASGPEWSRHLDGTKSLFDITKDRMMPMLPSPIPPSPENIIPFPTAATEFNHSPGRRAIFWNFARQDMLHAFINNHSTRLDTGDLGMWRRAGLKLTPEGYVCPSNPLHPTFIPENAMPDDLISNALIWLLQKLVNFISAGDDVPEALSPRGFGIRQQELLEYWESLDQQFRAWYEGLPDSFHPTAICTSTCCAAAGLCLEEHWFPRPMCASSMQSYHMARIQLLHNKPHLSTGATSAIGRQNSRSTSLAARHASYASILQQSRMHAKEIIAIALGRADEAARIHAVQPLWTAGLVLGTADDPEAVDAKTEAWRKVILCQLRAVERDMGWASEYRVQNLLDLWGLPIDWPNVEE